MELLQLKYFQVVARLENMTRAAEELHIAQPSLSKTISRLESQLGVPLFARQGKRIRLNQFGKAYLKRVNKCISELEDGKKELMDLAGEHGSLIVGSATAKLLPNLIKEYLLKYPHVKFQLFQVTHHLELQKQLIDGKIDFSISSLPIEQEGIHCQVLINEEIFLAVPPGHRLFERESIQLKEILDDPLIYYTTECGLREIMNHFCLQADFVPNIAFECTTTEITCSLVEAGLGVSFIPEYLWNILNTASLHKIHIENPLCQRSIWLSWRRDRYFSKAAERFKELVIEYFS